MCRIIPFTAPITLAAIFGATLLSAGQSTVLPDQQMIMCLLPIDHADAGQLSEVLSPLLSPQGAIVPYPPSNMLIIRDKSNIVKLLVKAVKGRDDLGQCLNFSKE